MSQEESDTVTADPQFFTRPRSYNARALFGALLLCLVICLSTCGLILAEWSTHRPSVPRRTHPPADAGSR